MTLLTNQHLFHQTRFAARRHSHFSHHTRFAPVNPLSGMETPLTVRNRCTRREGGLTVRRGPHAQKLPPGLQGVGFIHRVAVLGGGTAGYFAALALKARFADLDVTVIEAPDIPIIGVGEASTPLMPPFLHGHLGLDIVDLFREVQPTLKLGIHFQWGQPGEYSFNYPFSEADTVEAYAQDGDTAGQSLLASLMQSGRAPIVRDDAGRPVSLLNQLKFAYHLNNAPFVTWLAKVAKQRGIHLVSARIADVIVAADPAQPEQISVRSVRTTQGELLAFDLYVDASGFRSQLIGQALKTPFRDFSSTLFCDRAVVGEMPQDGIVRPYTTAETMDAGWCWRIAINGEDHRGYVFSSAFMDTDRAIAELKAKNPLIGDARLVKFRSGRHEQFWVGNVIAVGNAYGFVEPLESTALHMVIIELEYVLQALAEGNAEKTRPRLNRRIGAHWDYLRWFLGIHYKFNQRLDTPFWRAARAEVNISGLQTAVERFAHRGPWRKVDDLSCQVGDPALGYDGMMMLLLGQKAPGPRGRTRVDRDQWLDRRAAQAAMTARALPHAEALRVLSERDDFLRDFVNSPNSWCSMDAQRAAASPTGWCMGETDLMGGVPGAVAHVPLSANAPDFLQCNESLLRIAP